MCRGSGDPIAFDTGPGNALIDQWVAREGGVPFDADGAIASEGGVVRAVVERYLDNPFFGKSGPKSLDRNDFTLGRGRGSRTRRRRAHAGCGIGRGDPEVGRAPAADSQSCGSSAAAAARTRISSAICVKAREKAGAEVILAEDAGLRGDFIEAEAWAYLAVRSLKGLPLTFPTTTGCKEPVSGGVLVQP